MAQALTDIISISGFKLKLSMLMLQKNTCQCPILLGTGEALISCMVHENSSVTSTAHSTSQPFSAERHARLPKDKGTTGFFGFWGLFIDLVSKFKLTALRLKPKEKTYSWEFGV